MPAKPAPTRMSDVLPSPAAASTSTEAARSSAPATEAPLSSEGPTLPLLGASHNGPGKKRKRTTAAASTAPSHRKHTAPAPAPGRSTHASLYAPWTLLPARERKVLEESAAGNVEAVVWTRNQNVRAGVNKLKNLLCATPREGQEGKLVAVSALAQGATKLVGIVDVAVRVAGGGEERDGEERGEARTWFLYTVLSGVLVSRGRRGNEDGDGLAERKEAQGEGDAVDVDLDLKVDVDGDGAGPAGEHGGAAHQVRQSAQDMKRVPVLTVWMSRRSMAGWREVFGEREVVVVGAGEG
ncbi:hypothetical protein G6514_000979 [Epicoccum nigrum]|nr:hypothetical protein G6514_000979 [Epicoccum nigrum]